MCPSTVRISLVVPAFNEEIELPQLLGSVTRARENYSHGATAVQVIIADNASTDSTVQIAAAAGCDVVHVTRRSIASARNGGAKAAKGSILAFVDADSRIHPRTFDAIDETLTPDVIVGATGIKMSRNSIGIASTMLIITAITRIARVGPGVVFCRHADWAEVGGFDETRRYAEDVSFQIALKRLGRTRGQQFAWAKSVPTITSARKYDRFGDWHAFRLLWHFISGRRAFERFVDQYWYEPKRSSHNEAPQSQGTERPVAF